MASLTDVQAYLALSLFAAIAFLGIAYTGGRLAREHGKDIRVVWYLFSLSVVGTLLIGMWATSNGTIDSKGLFQGQWGSALHALLKFMLDLDTDVKFFASVLAVVVVPQITSYLLSGIFGCASSPIFVGGAVSIFVWSVVKSLVVAAGILLTVAIYGCFQGWESWHLRGAASMACLASMMLTLAFACLFMYRDMDAPAAMTPTTKFGIAVQGRLRRTRRWLTRKADGQAGKAPIASASPEAHS